MVVRPSNNTVMLRRCQTPIVGRLHARKRRPEVTALGVLCGPNRLPRSAPALTPSAAKGATTCGIVPGMRRSPFLITTARAIGALFLGRCLVPFVFCFRSSDHVALYGRFVGSAWFELVLAAVTAISLVTSYSRGTIGMLSATFATGAWLILTMLGPESWTA